MCVSYCSSNSVVDMYDSCVVNFSDMLLVIDSHANRALYAYHRPSSVNTSVENATDYLVLYLCHYMYVLCMSYV